MFIVKNLKKKLVLLLLSIVLLSLSCSLQKNKPVNSSFVQGKFKISYEDVKNPQLAHWREDIKKKGILEELEKDLNKSFSMSTDITISFSQCDTSNAFYDPEKRHISICYELVEDLNKSFANITDSKEELEARVLGAIIFTFYHELGHAFVDIYHLPITGKEEDAVDQLSTYILVNGTEEGEFAALSGADAFLLESHKDRKNLTSLAFYGEHSLSEQRFYNVLCWVYGHNSKKYQYLVDEDELPKERAEACEDEYKRLSRAWTLLLTPYRLRPKV
jgi:hypothetical protein